MNLSLSYFFFVQTIAIQLKTVVIICIFHKLFIAVYINSTTTDFGATFLNAYLIVGFSSFSFIYNLFIEWLPGVLLLLKTGFDLI